MELILINENKLKIILSSDEMERFDLDENEFHLCISNSRQILERILIEHGRHDLLNFTKGAKLLLQLYPDKNGGCELYVTRLYIENSLEENEEKDDFEKNPQSLALLPERTSKSNDEIGSVCYSFLNIADVISASRAILCYDEFFESTLYVTEEKKPFLFISVPHRINKKNPPFSILSEFGELENSERASLFLLERGDCIIKQGAVEILASL